MTPTPFIYPNRRWTLDSDIVMQPEPRTADQYSLDAKCELPLYNLTMDSSTGVISYMANRAKPIEAFSIECEVTAHLMAGVHTVAKVLIAADELNYKSSTLLFRNGSTESLLKTGMGWSKFELGCAPEVAH